MRFQEPPNYLEKGSNGPIADEVLKFLDEWARKNGLAKDGTGIVYDQEYGETGVRWMKKYQEANGIEADGGCGPRTRAIMLKNDNFDFAEASRKSDKLSCYVQPDGGNLYWACGIQETHDQEAALSRVYKAYHGN